MLARKTGKSGFFGLKAETLTRMQGAYDLAKARSHEGDIKVAPLARQKVKAGAPIGIRRVLCHCRESVSLAVVTREH